MRTKATNEDEEVKENEGYSKSVNLAEMVP